MHNFQMTYNVSHILNKVQTDSCDEQIVLLKAKVAHLNVSARTERCGIQNPHRGGRRGPSDD